MNTISKNILFYITIVENNQADHTFLRQMIHKVVPQAIVDSVYSDEEAAQYFSTCPTVPHLIFLDQDMSANSGKTIDLIKQINGLEKVPIIYLHENNSQKTNLAKRNTDHFYLKPFKAQDLLNIVGSVNSKWLA